MIPAPNSKEMKVAPFSSSVKNKKHHRSFGHSLPDFMAAPLFGDRKRFGRETQKNDPDWQAWAKWVISFYEDTQRQGLGKAVNEAGYSVLRSVDLSGKRVMEIGPGILPHHEFWKGVPESYVLVDENREFLKQSERLLQKRGITAESVAVSGSNLPFPDESFDVVIVFYVLEHLYPLARHLEEIRRVLRPGGVLIGAVPAEGGFLWGLGRFLTSRRYVKRYTSVNYDKVICWSHPNFADEILNELDAIFQTEALTFWPFRIPWIDANLIARFICRKDEPLRGV